MEQGSPGRSQQLADSCASAKTFRETKLFEIAQSFSTALPVGTTPDMT